MRIMKNMKSFKSLMFVLIFSMVVLLASSVVHADATSKLMSKVARQTDSSFALVKCKIVDELGARSMVGTGVCIANSPKIILMTYAIDPRIQANRVASIDVVVSGSTRKSYKAELLGIDPVTGLSFLSVPAGYPWKPVSFLGQSGLKVGDKIVSSGISIGDAELSRRVGLGYVANSRRTPDILFTVTGGTLTGKGSVVFNEQGQAVGIVGTQPYVNYDAYMKRQKAVLPLKNGEFTLAFTPVEEFVAIIQNIPLDGKARRLPWIGVQRFAAVQKTLAEAKGLTTPAVMLDQVIPTSQAAKVGLQSRDMIIAMDGKKLRDFATPELVAIGFTRDLMRKSIGQKVTFTVIQGNDNARRDIQLTLLPMPKMPSEANKLLDRQIGFLLREKVGIDRHLNEGPAANTNGMLVMAVVPGTPASRAGLKKDDVIIGINGKPITTAAAGKAAIATAMNNNPPLDLSVVIQRGAKRLRLTIETPER